MQLETPIEYLRGVGPTRARLLQDELGINTFWDLLHHFPFRYVDRSEFQTISGIVDENTLVQLRVRLDSVKEIPMKRGSRLEAVVSDDTGSLRLVWFKGVRYIAPRLISGRNYLLFGKPSRFKGRWSMNHPEFQVIEPRSEAKGGSIVPVYHSTEKLGSKGLDTKGLTRLIRELLKAALPEIEEDLPSKMMEDEKLMGRMMAFKEIHFPNDLYQMKKAKYRLKFEELFFLQLSLLETKVLRTEKSPGIIFEHVGDRFNDFYANHLPFDLTDAQKRVMKEIRRDLGSGKQMNRLLQGDVGSGKTIVALLTMLIGIDNGCQAAIMAPTEILATQHQRSMEELLSGTGVRCALLTGSTPKAQRKTLHQALEYGELHILIGTHALLEDKVKFKDLGVVIIDEQHRFGVAQRAKLWKKNTRPPHVLVMTATPIPRTLAMTFYGDLDTSRIDELPPGRKPVQTVHRNDTHRIRVFGFLEDQIARGRQVYVVYPLIEESQKMEGELKDLMDGFESLSRRFPSPKYQIGILHGRMKPEDKDYEMMRFAKGDTHIMVSTTVIEVGVNVPNASVMVIESAERFGLSQLHQLRGRVGRGSDQSYCILMSGPKLSADAKTRLQTMVDTNDGFQIAEVDLRLRGAGDIMGTRQSGDVELKLADLVNDGPILQRARGAALHIIQEDPKLQQPEHKPLIPRLKSLMQKQNRWGRIS